MCHSIIENSEGDEEVDDGELEEDGEEDRELSLKELLAMVDDDNDDDDDDDEEEEEEDEEESEAENESEDGDDDSDNEDEEDDDDNGTIYIHNVHR